MGRPVNNILSKTIYFGLSQTENRVLIFILNDFKVWLSKKELFCDLIIN